MDPLLGQIVHERFRVVEKIGEGGMAAVYRALDLETGEPVALKVLAPALRASRAPEVERHVGRFRREARIIEALAPCPQVPRFVAAHLEGDVWSIAMELIEGRALREVIARSAGKMPAPLYLDLATQIVRGLAAIHESRVLHRDLTPDNILVAEREGNPYEVKFLDFGFGKGLGSDFDAVTQVSTVLGKPQYLAPEQAVGGPVTGASDVYSLGVVLYEMLTGRLPINIHSMAELVRLRREEPVPLADHPSSARIPDELRRLIMSCLAKEASTRPTPAALLEALLRFRDESGWEPLITRLSVILGPENDFAEGAGRLLLEPGADLGPYRVLGPLGSGPRSEIWLCEDTEARREVALKVLYSPPVRHERQLARLRDGLRLDHPGLARVRKVDVHQDHLCLALDLVFGTSLETTLAEDGAMTSARLLNIATEILAVLEYAHDLAPPVVHGHLNPGNVLLDDFDSVSIVDFGIGVVPCDLDLVDEEAGDLAFLSPEQGLGGEATTASDVYAFGCVLYAMATGVAPFRGPTSAVLYHHHTAAPVSPDRLRPELEPAGLAAIIVRCLAKDPAARPGVAALRKLLDRAFGDPSWVPDASGAADPSPLF